MTKSKIIKKSIKSIGYFKYFAFICLSIILGTSNYFTLIISEDFVNILNTDKETFNILFTKIFICVIIVIILVLLNNINKYFINHSKKNITMINENSISKHISKIKYDYFNKYETLKKIKLSSENINCISNVIFNIILSLFSCVIKIITYIYILIQLNYVFLIIFLLLSLIYGYVSYKAGKKTNYESDEYDYLKIKRGYLGKIANNSRAHQDIKMNDSFEFIKEKIEENEKDCNKYGLKTATYQYKYIIFPDMLYFIISIFLIIFSVNLIVRGYRPIGLIGQVLTLIFMIRETILDISFNISGYIENKKYIDMFDEVLEYETMLNNDKNNNIEKIEINNLSYKYPDSNTKVINGITLSIFKGEKIAIVGNNGSGKTTLVNILLGMFNDYSGEIKVHFSNGDIGNSLIDYAEVVSQNIFYIQDDIANNIRLYKDIYNDYNIMEAIEDVNLTKKINNLKNGIYTLVGNINVNGQSLSVGEWQKIAIARTLLNETSQIYILDEPTSAMNPNDEIEFYNKIYEKKKDKTILFISHRLGFTKKADRIIVLKDGLIDEIGTFKQLYEKKGLFYEMYNIQKKEYD